MRKTILLAFVILTFGCKEQKENDGRKNAIVHSSSSEGMEATKLDPQKLGEDIFNGKRGCAACHKMDTKLIGPSMQQIAKQYQEQKGSIVEFLKGESEAIVSPTQFAIMQPSLSLTKTMTDEELKGLEAYIMASFEVYPNKNK